jgi:hypothetical protein
VIRKLISILGMSPVIPSGFILLIFCTLLNSCKTDRQQEKDLSLVKTAPLSVESLDSALFASKSVKDVQIFLDKHPYLLSLYFADSRMNSAQLANQLFTILQNPDFQSFRIQLDSLIGNRDSLVTRPLEEAFKKIKSYYPNFKAPKIKFMITGFTGNDLYVSDSLIIIGLDYFGGKAALFRPDVYQYQLTRFEKDHIVPSIIFFMAAKYNRMNPSDRSLLSDMIGYGKDYTFTKQILPQTPESVILGFSDDDLKRTYNSQTDIWAYFIAGKLLYEKSDLTKQKYVGERPFTTEIGNKVPGGIGRWLGWRIVNRYVKEHPDVTLPELMEKDNAVNLLEESGYNGQKDEEE